MDTYKCWDCEKIIHGVLFNEEAKEKMPKNRDGFIFIICSECVDNEEY